MQHYQDQCGAITLLMTSVLLAAALMMNLASMKTVMYQIKRAQNEVKVRQIHWRLEGGIECAAASVVAHQSNLAVVLNHASQLDRCAAIVTIDSLAVEALPAGQFVITATFGLHQIRRRFHFLASNAENSGQTRFRWVRGGWYVE